ncbi:MAG: hypothetical protein V1779_05475 [bacterium]
MSQASQEAPTSTTNRKTKNCGEFGETNFFQPDNSLNDNELQNP